MPASHPPARGPQARRILGPQLAIGAVSQRPSFRLHRLPAAPHGEPTFNEGYIFDGDGGLIPARVVEAPWLTRLQSVGEDASLVLETPSGTVHNDGETILSTHDIYHDDKMYSTQALKQEMPSFPALQQAGVCYRWDGEETFGMLERSNPLDKITG